MRLCGECDLFGLFSLSDLRGGSYVEPFHYDDPPCPGDEPIDPERDATALAMVRARVAAEVPVFGICRGIREMNVALGGSLHYRLHLLADKDDHRMSRHDDVTVEEIFELRHSVGEPALNPHASPSATLCVSPRLNRYADARTSGDPEGEGRYDRARGSEASHRGVRTKPLH